MKKVSEYDKTMIAQHKRNLENALIESIRDILDGEEDIDCELDLSWSCTIRNIRSYSDGVIEIDYHYMDWDGDDYACTATLEDMDINELYTIWKFLVEKTN